MAKWGTLPSFCYQEKLPIERVSLRTKTRDGGEGPSTSRPAGSDEAGSVDEEEQENGTDLSDEFNSDESDDAEVEPSWKKIPIWEDCTFQWNVLPMTVRYTFLKKTF